ncbi:MAG: NAD(P)/FAD-dependent oxidoreductase [Pikeienuella sp.]
MNPSSPAGGPVPDGDRRLPDSYWAATAGPQIELIRPEGEIEADAVVIGGGFTGLRCALELALKGVAVVVIDAEEPGWGASGRSGGQVNPLPHRLPEEIAKIYGPRHAEIFFAAAAGCADELFGVIRDHGVDCEHYQHGWVQAAHKPARMPLLETRQREWAKRGIEVEMISRREIIEKVGAPGYHGGAIFPRGGAIHPLGYTRGLAHAAIRAGARIFAKTRADTLSREGEGWRLGCNRGAATIRCRNVVLATNAYTTAEPVPALARAVNPVCTIQAASAPLSEEQLQSVMPGRTTLADTRRALFYTRRTGENRITLGALAHHYDAIRPDDRERIHVGLSQVFPQLKGLKWDYYWHGWVAHTEEMMPHFHEPLPGIFAGLGFNGRGVAMTTVMGRTLAERVLGADPKTLPFPTLPMKSNPYRLLGRLGMRLAVSYFETMDAIDNRANREWLTKPA